MKRLIKTIILLGITAYILYYVNDRYNLVEWVVEMNAAFNHDNPDAFIGQLREAMLEGKKHVTLTYVGKSNDLDWFTEEAVDMVYTIDDKDSSSDYDYLKYKTESIASHIVGLGNIMTITYDFSYNESKSETDEVDKKIRNLFRKWEIEKLSDYQKIKKIHDYIINNASYDTSLQYYSAYDNLINKSSTCQGYMSLAYKMLTEAGVPCRIISGTAGKESHGWNIVMLEEKWYNLDCTWDDPITWDGEELLVYDYFLKSEEDFEDHVRDKEYRTEGFHQEYTMGMKSYEH